MLSTPKVKSGLFLASSLCDGLEDNNIRQVATLLVDKDANPNVLIPTHGVTPFHLVIGNDSLEFAEEVTKLFLRHGGDPNVRSNDGMTPVHVAAAWGRINILQLLLANGGDPLCLDNDGRSPFHYAFKKKYFKVVTMLAKYCENIQDEDNKPKYNMILGKVLVSNGNFLAEYVTSKDRSLYLNVDNKPKNNEPLDIYNDDSVSSSMIVELNSISHIYNVNEDEYKLSSNLSEEYEEKIDVETVKSSSLVNNITSQQNNLSPTDERNTLDYSAVDLDFDCANMQLSDIVHKEKYLVSKIINQLSTTLTSDCTINETIYNYKGKRQKEKNGDDTSNFNIRSSHLKENINALYKYTYHKNSKNFLSKLKHKKDILELNASDMKKQYLKYNSSHNLKKKDRKLSDFYLTPNYDLDDPIIITSPRCKIPNRKKNDTTRMSLIFPLIHNDIIISKSPNFTTPFHINEKRSVSQIFSVDNYFSSKISKKSHEYKAQYFEINQNKKHMTQSTPRRKKRSIFKLHCGRKKLDFNRRENNVNKLISHNVLKPVNLNKTIFSEINENETYDTLNSNLDRLSLNFKTSPRMKQHNCYDNLTVKLDEEKYDKNNITHSSELNQIDFDNSFNQTGRENESINNFDNNKKYNLESVNSQINTPFITIQRDKLKIDKTLEAIDSSINNIKFVHTNNECNLQNENDMDCIDCDTEKLLNEDINMNMRKNCNLHSKNWCNDKFHEPLSCKLSTKNNLYIPNTSLHTECKKLVCLSNYHTLHSLKIDENNSDLKRAEDILKNENIDKESEKSSSRLSYISAQEEYKYEDTEKGIILLERRFCVTPFSRNKYDVKNKMTDISTFSQSLPKELLFIDDTTLRKELRQLGDQPGPITNTTRRVYLKRLMHLRNISIKDIDSLPQSIARFTPEDYVEQDNRIMPHLNYGNWVNRLNIYRSLEKYIFREFVSPNPSRRWREGISKTSFTYLLLDPRITQDLPYRSTSFTEAKVWSIFLNAIFYIGKGKRSRPFAHLYDAFNIWTSKTATSANKKINRILDIWNNDHGVICLHVFQNIIPVEAYTIEAAMIDAMGLECLENCKSGEYYGIAATWNMQQKRKFGRYLLYKALQILLHEGERQIFPQNL